MSHFVIYFLIQFQIILIGSKIGCAAKPYLTLFNFGSAFNNAGQLQCYPTDTTTTITMGKVFKISTSDSLTEATLMNHAYSGAKRLYIPYDGNFFGVYYCKVVLNGETTIVNTTVVDLKDAFDSDIIPANRKTSITTSAGDSVTVSFDVTGSGNHIWRKDGELLADLYDVSSLTFNSVSAEDAGMYELNIEEQRDEYKHSFIELIVRGCPAGRWGAPRCTSVCNNCYNGGVCDDETGNCICPPGFQGENCEMTCGGNRFGNTCQIRCTKMSTDPKDACKGHTFCLPKPYGCDCGPGYTGLNCLTECDSGKFGAGCSQECHCASGGCNQYTGNCMSGTCASGWIGSNCQVPSTCPVGYFGTACTSICHCRGNVQCDRDTGVCSNAECAEGYRIYDNLFCEACQSRSYGDSCALTCNCGSSSCHHETGCDGGCLDNWLPKTCTARISSTSNSQVNPGQMSIFQCDIQGDNMTGATIQFLINNQPTTAIGSTESNGVTSLTFTGVANTTFSYVCQLTNNSHRAYARHSLTTFELPTYTGQPILETVIGSSVVLRWREWSTSRGDTGDPPVTGYVVYFKLSSSESWSQTPQVSSLTATVTGLHWEERYKFAIAAVREGAGGEGPMGSDRLSAWTRCGEPSAPVVGTNSSYESPKRITIFWKKLTDAQSKCSTGVNHYNISYRAVNTDMATVTEETTEELSYTIVGLETYTKYSISVTAINKDSSGMSGVVQVFSPEEEPPPPDVSAVHEGTYLTVSVMPSKLIEKNLYGNIKGYDIRYRLASDEEWINLSITKDQGSSYKITNLETGANYEVSARVINGAGAGNWSASTGTSTGTTESSIPGFMIALVVVLFTVNIILLFLLFGLYYRYKQTNGNNTPRCEVQATTDTLVAEDENELGNYTNLIKDDLAQQNQYDSIQTATQDTYNYAMPPTSGLEVTTAEENIRVAKHKNEPYKIPLKQMGHESISVSNDIPQYSNIN